MASDEIPIFPLSQVVLFPGVRCPLHVFEQRYRDMTAAALAANGRIGMVAVRPEHTDDMAGDPPVFQVGCEGRIVESNRHPDGRYDILLLGGQRFRIREEPPREGERLYRTARIERLSDEFAAAEMEPLAELRAGTLDKLGALVNRATTGRQRFDPDVFAEVDDVTLVNALCQMLDLLPAEKQGLLEEGRVLARLEQLSDLLDFRLVQLPGAVDDPSRTIH